MVTPRPPISRPWRRGRAGAPAPDAGFTLIELIIVISLIGILVTMAMPSLTQQPRRAEEAVLKTNLHTLRDVLDQYHADQGHFPTSLEVLVDDGYLRRIPRDPIADTDEWDLIYEELDLEDAPAETDLPEEGQPGIMDVRSTAEGESLDGTPYSEW